MSGYRGRFAPTPSGPLHFGSLVAALASFLDARHVGGEWLLRIEDVDPPRCPPGTSDVIRRQLEAYGLSWDAAVMIQSERDAPYQAVLARLAEQRLAYPCSCSRKEWRDYPIYPGWCRSGPLHPERALAWRLRSDLGARPVSWHDRLFGEQRYDPAALGDVVLKRKEGLWSYQLAVVVDDAEQGISDVVRGADLLDNTPWQLQLQAALGYPQPRYLHLPLIVAANGQKLSKQNRAAAIPVGGDAPRDYLHRALVALDQAPPRELTGASVTDQLAAAIAAWDPARLHREAKRQAPDPA